MATPRNPLETFIWGSGGRAMTPEQVAREREIAAALTDQGADFSPVGHWLQGAARLGHSAAGAFRDWRASEGERAGREGFSDRWSSVFGGGSSPVAEALSGGVASPALDAANAVAAMPTGDMADRVRSGLMERGLPEHVANAFILNMQDESGLNPGINEAAPIVPGSRGGYGLYQLTGPRRRDYEAFAAQRGVAPDDVDAQLDWLMHELSGPEARAAQSILSAQDTPTAAAAIVNEFLRPAEEHRTRRANAYMAGSGSMPNAQPVQVAQAGGSPSIAELLSLSGDPNFGYASPAQQQIVQALMGQQLQQQDPAYQQGLALGDVNLRRGELELEQMMNPPAPFQPIPMSPEEMAAWGIPEGSGSWARGEDGMPQRIFEPTPDPTSVQEYEYYLRQAEALGQQPVSYVEWDNARKAAGATNISNVVGGETGPKLGSLSTDYGYVLDPETKEPVIDSETGLATAAPVPGSPAAREIEAAQAQAESREAQAATQAGTVTQDTGIALQGLGELGGLSADNGPAGANWRRLQAGIAGTPEHRIQTFVNSALANVGFDQLNQMRQNSPTGGALGNVTELQLRQLESVLGQYDIGLPIEDQQFILQRISNIYSDIVFGSRAERDRAVREGKLTPEQADRYDQYYYPETRDAMGRRLEEDDTLADQEQQSQSNPAIFLAPGTVEDGYRFLGGDPADPNSWERVQ